MEKAQIDVQSKNRGGERGSISSVLPNSACPDSCAASLLVSLITLNLSFPAIPRPSSLVGWIFFQLLNRIFLSPVFGLLVPPFLVSFLSKDLPILLGSVVTSVPNLFCVLTSGPNSVYIANQVFPLDICHHL